MNLQEFDQRSLFPNEDIFVTLTKDFISCFTSSDASLFNEDIDTPVLPPSILPPQKDHLQIYPCIVKVHNIHILF